MFLKLNHMRYVHLAEYKEMPLHSFEVGLLQLDQKQGDMKVCRIMKGCVLSAKTMLKVKYTLYYNVQRILIFMDYYLTPM